MTAWRLHSRHMRGTIEAERDARRHDPALWAAKAAGAARRRARLTPHPRLTAALAAGRRPPAGEADRGLARWEDEGGHTAARDPVVVARG